MPVRQRPRIALWGGASLSNVGDQLLFDVVQSGLARRLPGAEFARYCPWAADGEQARPLWVSPAGSWPGAGSFDAVVIVGGVFAGPPFSNVLMQAFTLGAEPGRFDPRAVVAWHGVGLDDSVLPPGRPEWCAYLQALAGRLDRCTVRAPSAASRFEQAEAPVPGVVPDPSFALPRPAGPRPPARGRRLRIGVAIGEAAVSRRFLDTITDMRVVLRYVRQSGFDRATCLDAAGIAGQELADGELARKREFSRQLALGLAGLQRAGTVEFVSVDNMYDDGSASAAFAAALGGATVRHVARASADELSAALGGYDLVVVSRYHSVILALRAGVPFIAADPYWSPGAGTSKVHQLLADLGCTDRHWTGAAPGAVLTGLAEVALAGAAEDRDRYLRQHARALDALDGLAAAISAGR
jgi:polysaccharide pyruvyl transferase WcaK-like protein